METQRLFSKQFNSFADWNGSAWEDKSIAGAYFYSLKKAANNGYYPEKSDREKAIEWYCNLPIGKMVNLRLKYGSNLRKNVADEEIEQIWREEHKLFVEATMNGKSYTFGERPQVDFESVLGQVRWILNDSDYSLESRNNLKLFFELLSKSSTFAHKAHKELNKLMK